jgi:putative beta-lysine N-acetyltransferase
MSGASAVAGARRLELAGDRWRATVTASDLNRRLQVLEHRGPDVAELAEVLRQEAESRSYGKVFLKARALERPALEAAGMEAEATLWGYFDGVDGVVMSMFVDDERRQRPFAAEEAAILEGVMARPPEPDPRPLPRGYRESTAGPEDAEPLAELYADVFASYPFPITDPGYLRDSMASHVVYRLIRNAHGRLVAAASAETAPALSNAEMTDFATRPGERGNGLALRLLAGLEEEMAVRGLTNLYTIARARSFGMNRVFRNRGYEMTGTLANNCHIAGQFEDMHVWCRTLEG